MRNHLTGITFGLALKRFAHIFLGRGQAIAQYAALKTVLAADHIPSSQW